MTEYEKQINALIPKASKIADQRVRKLPPNKRSEERKSAQAQREINGRHYYYHCFWSQFFHKAMNELAFAAGLRSWK